MKPLSSTPASPHTHFDDSSPPRSPSPPSQTFHPALLSSPLPSIGLFGAAAGAHYSGAKLVHRRSDVQRASFGSGIHNIELDDKRRQVVNDLKQLFACQPTAEIIERTFRSDAVFEDPLTYCKGIKEIAAQWFALQKFCSDSATISSRMLSSTHHPNRLVFSQKQQYTLRLFGIKKTIESIVVVDLDDEGKIVKLEDQWSGEDPPSKWGASALRRLNGKTMLWVFRVPKDLR